MDISDRFAKERSVSVSGHRPEKLGFSCDRTNMLEKRLISLLYARLEECLNEGRNCFFTGGSRGVDLWAAEIVTIWKNEGRDVKLITVLPYKGYGSSYTGSELYTFNRILDFSDAVEYISQTYTRDCMFRRNEYMVDHSSVLVAVLREERSGTGQTIRYAKKRGTAVKLIDLNRESELFT